jgi:hypothetical protein
VLDGGSGLQSTGPAGRLRLLEEREEGVGPLVGVPGGEATQLVEHLGVDPDR